MTSEQRQKIYDTLCLINNRKMLIKDAQSVIDEIIDDIADASWKEGMNVGRESAYTASAD